MKLALFFYFRGKMSLVARCWDTAPPLVPADSGLLFLYIAYFFFSPPPPLTIQFSVRLRSPHPSPCWRLNLTRHVAHCCYRHHAATALALPMPRCQHSAVSHLFIRAAAAAAVGGQAPFWTQPQQQQPADHHLFGSCCGSSS